MTLGLVLPAQ